MNLQEFILNKKKFRRLELIKALSVSAGDKPEEVLDAVHTDLCEAINSPKSLAAHILMRNHEYAQLVSLTADPSDYLTAYEYADDSLIVKSVSKYKHFRHKDLDPLATAKETFHRCELACRETNKRFATLDLDPSLWDPTMYEIFHLARRKIRSVLRTPDLNSISEKFAWGPGVTTSSSGSECSAYNKFGDRLDVTSNCLVIGRCCVNSIPSWVNCQLQTDIYPSVEVSLTYDAFNVVRGNEIVFVAKDAKTHRIIAKEPPVNSYIQKGIGSEMKRLFLRNAGVDLSDQTYNQRLALQGSLYDDIATIDLKDASAMQAFGLVKFMLFDTGWWTLLDSARCKQGLMDGIWYDYQMFSSMGNAFTFELESIIFWALAKATMEVMRSESDICNVFGDDVIVPSDMYADVARVFSYAGFVVNEKKSFSSGPFRESCGKDYFNGIEVRPIFIKESIASIESIFKLANGIRRYSHRRNFNYGCDVRFRTPWYHLVRRLPEDFTIFKIPDGFGDSGIVVNFDEAVPSLGRPKGGLEGYLFNAIIRVPAKRPMRDEHRAYVTMLSAAGASNFVPTDRFARIDTLCIEEKLPLQGSYDLRRMTIPKRTRLSTVGWYNLGPWC